MKTGIIDAGGGFRDVYGAGVLEACMEQEIHVDYCIGISAGALRNHEIDCRASCLSGKGSNAPPGRDRLIFALFSDRAI